MVVSKETVFTKDASGKKLNVVREFDAPVDKVWSAWTESEILDQWWAPRPWMAVTESMDFRPGGQWFYYMKGPEGEKHYCVVKYLSIDPGKNFTSEDMFSDDKGNPNNDLPTMKWNSSFLPASGHTRVELEIIFKSAEDMKTIMEMGFKEGFESALRNLDEILG